MKCHVCEELIPEDYTMAFKWVTHKDGTKEPLGYHLHCSQPSTKEQWRGVNHMAEVREMVLPVWFGKGWSAQEPKPHLFRTLVRSIPPTKGHKQITYTLDCVDYMSEKPPDDTVPAFEKSVPKLREMLRVSLANTLDVSLDRIKYVKRNVLWCGVSE